MNVKTILYVVVSILTLLGLDSININNLFKKNKYYQARLLYFLVTFAITYLVVNFIMDFFTYSRLI